MTCTGAFTLRQRLVSPSTQSISWSCAGSPTLSWSRYFSSAATTGGTSLAAYLAALALGRAAQRQRGPAQASTVAFSSIIGTQLAQTFEASRTADGLSIPIAASVVGSAGLLVAAQRLSLIPI